MRRTTPVEPRPSVPPRVGLITSAQPPPATDPPEWEGGFAWNPESCSGGGGISDLCDDAVRTPDSGGGIRRFEPFQIWEGERCSTFGYSERDWQGRARRLLEACESKHIERELWRGDFARADVTRPNDYLARDASTLEIVTTAPTAPREVLALIEQGIADHSCGQPAMIHATRQTVALWDELQMLRRERGLILTVNENVVVPGAGYDGSGPGAAEGDAPVAAAAGSVWAYATDMVTVRRGPIEPLPGSLQEARDWARAVDSEVNTVMVLAQRTVAATFDGCLHLGAEIDIDPPA